MEYSKSLHRHCISDPSKNSTYNPFTFVKKKEKLFNQDKAYIYIKGKVNKLHGVKV